MRKILIYIMLSISIWADGLELELSTGFLNGVAHELVYKDSIGTKYSELIWGLDSVPMVKIGMNYGEIKAKVDINYIKGESTMDDYDWMINSTEWTHWSNSPTDIKNVIKLDINYEYSTNIRDFKLGILTGYRLDYYNWLASGGSYIYSNDNTGDRAKIGTFPDIPGISYEQFYSTPYVGLSGLLQLDLIKMYLNICYSPLVYAQDKDIHYLRENGGMVFEGVFDYGTFIEINAGGEVAISDAFLLNLSYVYSNYLTNKGYYTGYYIGTGDKFSGSYGSVGLDNETSTISLGLTYKF